MAGVLLTGHGGFDKLVYRNDLPVPTPGVGEVLIRVAAAGVNNTDINTRIGWYSKSVKSETATGGTTGFAYVEDTDASWSGTPMSFPRIQGGDCCGYIVGVGEGVDSRRVGERVIVRNVFQSYVGYRPWEIWTFGSEVDGAFAEYTKAPSRETYRVECDWSDVELASMPCAYSTVENMLQRAHVQAGDHVLITGASGGVGSAAIQLAKRRGASITAVATSAKSEVMLQLGANRVHPRGESIVDALGRNCIDVVLDVTAGPDFRELLEVLKPGGRYAVAGAIAGPIVELDVRTVYLKDLTLFGCTFQDEVAIKNIVSYIERGEIRPLVSKSYSLKDIVVAQKDFLAKNFSGKLVLRVPE
ncbi:alcohol dehydrogenase family protein [Mesorhizobium sp. M1334]|uniref:alcohol dehydrogenase family protein n=1 Tax=Mesorhizobium sp. M1334 TaxID=2957084 RepID=UPI003334FCC8